MVTKVLCLPQARTQRGTSQPQLLLPPNRHLAIRRFTRFTFQPTRFQDNRHENVVRLSALLTARVYSTENIFGIHLC